MGANTSALLSEEIEEIAKESHLTSKEIKRLYKRFQKLDRNSSGTIEVLLLLLLLLHQLRQMLLLTIPYRVKNFI